METVLLPSACIVQCCVCQLIVDMGLARKPSCNFLPSSHLFALHDTFLCCDNLDIPETSLDYIGILCLGQFTGLPGTTYTYVHSIWRVKQMSIQACLCSQASLATVKIKQADVDILVHEFEISKKVAEQRLREHQGGLRPAIESFL